jgi:hypothetical protein
VKNAEAALSHIVLAVGPTYTVLPDMHIPSVGTFLQVYAYL